MWKAFGDGSSRLHSKFDQQGCTQYTPEQFLLKDFGPWCPLWSLLMLDAFPLLGPNGLTIWVFFEAFSCRQEEGLWHAPRTSSRGSQRRFLVTAHRNAGTSLPSGSRQAGRDDFRKPTFATGASWVSTEVDLKSGDWKSLGELVTGQSLKEYQKKRDLVQAELDFLDKVLLFGHVSFCGWQNPSRTCGGRSWKLSDQYFCSEVVFGDKKVKTISQIFFWKHLQQGLGLVTFETPLPKVPTPELAGLFRVS